MESSPLHTQLLKKNPKRYIYSSEEETESGRPAEVMDSQHSTHSDCSPNSCANGGLSPPSTPMIHSSQESGIIIWQIHGDDSIDSPWNSDCDSETSTPSFNRGKHDNQGSVPAQQSDISLPANTDNDQPIRQEAIQELLRDGLSADIPRWLRGRGMKQSIFILVDAQITAWPGHNICAVEFHASWTIKRWTESIRTGIIRVLPCPIVVVYLEATQYWSDVPPVKNALHGLCKALRNYSNAADPRIFIANHLPRVSASPLRKQITQTNFILQQAVRSVGRSLERVFELSLYEHFTSRHGSLLKPVSKYFASEQLSYLGCLVMRECVLCEVGFKRYWFDRRPRRHQSKKWAVVIGAERQI